MANDPTTLSDIGEFGLIRHLTGEAARALEQGVLGPGDDCAVIALSPEEGRSLLLTCDAYVEGRHFRLDYSSGYDIGWKILAASTSDIAAMGGEPDAALLSLQLPAHLDIAFLDNVYRGIGDLAGRFGIRILGGDTTASDVLAFSVTVVGWSSGDPILRSGAKPDEDIWVSGSIGEAGAGLDLLLGRISADAFPDRGACALARHRRPQPRLELGRFLARERLASSLIDVSDGLLQDLGHIAEMSKVCCSLEVDRVPYEKGVLESGFSKAAALCAGDDYELLFTAPKSARGALSDYSTKCAMKSGCGPLSMIGETLPWDAFGGDSVVVRLGNGEAVASEKWLVSEGWIGGPGYRHFSSEKRG